MTTPMTEVNPTEPGMTALETRRQRLLDSYEAKTTVAMSALALVYLVTYSAQAIFWNPNATWFRWAAAFGLVVWILFAIDLAFRILLSPRRWHFIKTHPVDVITVVIPQMRALRALRAFTSGGILSKGKGAVSGKAVATAMLATILTVWVGSLMVLTAERGAQGAEITSFGDAMWWVMETVTTVGYGDFVPVTAWGRIIAVLIMMVGISVLGVVSAGMAATLVKQTQGPPPPDRADEVLAELADLKQMVAALQAQLATGGPDSPATGSVTG